MGTLNGGHVRLAHAAFAGLLATVIAVGGLLGAAAPARGLGTPVFGAATALAVPGHCRGWHHGMRRADELLAGRYQLGTHPAVELGLDPTWRENPLDDNNWAFLHHSLQAVLSLYEAHATTGDARYLERAAALLHDWQADNPWRRAASRWAWNDHSTALRAIVYACARTWMPSSGWLQDALTTHGRVLADPDFYVVHGNHALNQSLGLLEIGVVMDREDWRRIAAERINRLVKESVDVQGVTNEQAVVYQAYNYQRYNMALRRLSELGIPAAAAFNRIPRMTGFLAHATLPDGTYETIGDTDPGPASLIPGTMAEYPATLGRSGRKPGDTVAVYHAGYMFARTGWGEDRPIADETFLSFRWGPPPFVHGHADHGAITLYGYGSRLLVDPGRYTYNMDAWRNYFKGRRSHNVVTVDGVPWNVTVESRLVSHERTATMADAVVDMRGYAGVRYRRHVTFSRKLGYTLVEDTLTSNVGHTYRQQWHLPPESNPLVRSTYFYSRRASGNVQVQQLLDGSTSRLVVGATSPIQGWVATSFAHREPAPVVQVARSGRNVRFLTLLLTAPGRPRATVSGLKLTPTGYTVVVTVDGHAERVSVDGTTASIVPLPQPAGAGSAAGSPFGRPAIAAPVSR